MLSIFTKLPDIYGIWVIKCSRPLDDRSPLPFQYVYRHPIKLIPLIVGPIRVGSLDIPLSHLPVMLIIMNRILRHLSLPNMLSHSLRMIKVTPMNSSPLSGIRALEHVDILVVVEVDVFELTLNVVSFGVIGSLLKIALVFDT